MTLGADIHLHFLLGRAGFKRLAAYAAHNALAVLGMDVLLHGRFTSFPLLSADKTASNILSHPATLCKLFFPECEICVKAKGIRPLPSNVFPCTNERIGGFFPHGSTEESDESERSNM